MLAFSAQQAVTPHNKTVANGNDTYVSLTVRDRFYIKVYRKYGYRI